MTLHETWNRAYETQDWEEYKVMISSLRSELNISDDQEISKLAVRQDGTIRFIDTVKRGETVKFPKGTVLVHYSNRKFNSIESSFRSIDGVFYRENRVYFWIDDEANCDRNFQYRYKYICTGDEEFRFDTEFESTYQRTGKYPAAYIAADSPFSVKVSEAKERKAG